MKSKSDKNQAATKQDVNLVKGELKGDIKALGEVFEKKLKSEIALVRLDVKEAFEKHEEKHREYRDEILTKMDGIAADLQAKREDDAAGAKILEDHDKRIRALESV